MRKFLNIVEGKLVNDDWFKTGSFKTQKKIAAGDNPVKEPFVIADTDGELDHLEGKGKKQKYKRGYYIITGVQGEKYSMPPETFHELKIDNGDGTATPKQIVKLAKVADHSGIVKTSWGEDLHYDPEIDVIVRHGPNDYGVVKREIFNKTYELV